MDSVQLAMQTLTQALDSANAEKESWQLLQSSLLARISDLEKENARHCATQANMARRIKMLELALQQRSHSSVVQPPPAEPVRKVKFSPDLGPSEELTEAACAEDSMPLLPLQPTVGSDRVQQNEWIEAVSLRCHLDKANAVAFHHTEPLLCSAGRDGTLKLWNLANLSKRREDNELEVAFTLRGHLAAVNMCKFRMDGRQIVSCSDDCTIRLWSVPPRDESLYQPFGRSVLCHERTFTGHTAAVLTALTHPISDSVLSTSKDGTVRLWGSGDSYESFQQTGQRESIATCAGFVLGQQGALLGYDSGDIILLDTDKMAPSLTMRAKGSEDAAVLSVASHHTLPLAISAQADGSIACFDLRSGAETHQIKQAHKGQVNSLDIDSTGLVLASGGDDCKVHLWDIGRWELLESHCCHVGAGAGCGVLGVGFHPDKRVLASAGADSTVQVYHQQHQ